MSDIFNTMKNQLIENDERRRLDELKNKYGGMPNIDYTNMSLQDELQTRYDLRELDDLQQKYPEATSTYTSTPISQPFQQPQYGDATAKALDNYLKDYKMPEWPNYFGPLAPVIDYARNYYDMRSKNLEPSDKFFHCKANYEAASRDGYKYNDAIAKQLGDTREWFDQTFKGNTPEMSLSDQRANFRGRWGAKMGKTLQETCPTHYKDYEK